MEVLPFVSFVLWATGLSTFTLAGLMAIDWYKSRRMQDPATEHPQRLDSAVVASVSPRLSQPAERLWREAA